MEKVIVRVKDYSPIEFTGKMVQWQIDDDGRLEIYIDNQEVAMFEKGFWEGLQKIDPVPVALEQ